MATIHLDETTTFMSEQSVAGLTDFGPGRSGAVFPQRRHVPKVHDEGPGRQRPGKAIKAIEASNGGAVT